ncbi:MAG TPA: acyl-CoA carboxylase subunit beta [Micromonospora sp.]
MSERTRAVSVEETTATPAGRPEESPAEGWLPAVMAAHEAVLDAARPEAVARQHSRGKLTARERIAALVDPGTFVEYGRLATADESYEDVVGIDSPADGVVTGIGDVNGRPAAIIATDFTVMGGSIGHTGLSKMVRLAEMSLDQGIPFIMLLDGGGHRIQEGLDSRSFAFGGPGTFPCQVKMSGWVPQVTAIMGPGFAGPANFSSLADFVPMVKGTSSIGIAGPPLVKFATGEDKTAEELGGAAIATRTGVVDIAVDDDLACIAKIKEFLSYFPQNCREPLPIVPCDDPEDRRAEELRHIVPLNRRRAYDIRAVIRLIVDHGEFLELKEKNAPNVVTVLARMGGRPVGIVANQPKALAGVLDTPACDKASRFISMCDAFGLPIISLIDLPGFMVGSQAEATALVRHSGKMLSAFGNATVPIISVALRKGYGLGYLAMAGGRSFNAEAALAWPSAELCAMQIEGAVDVAYRKDYQAAPDPAARRAELIDSFYQRVNPIRAAAGFGIDDVIDPADTRPTICSILRFARPRAEAHMPPKFHGIEPI